MTGPHDRETSDHDRLRAGQAEREQVIQARTPATARRHPLAKAAAGSGLCLVIAVAARWAVGHFDPGGIGPNPEHYLAPPFILLFFLALLAALGILVAGVAVSVKQRRAASLG